MAEILKELKSRYSEAGIAGILGSARRRFRSYLETRQYRQWIKEFDTLTDAKRASIRSRIAEFEPRILISVVMPVFNTPDVFLRKAIDSVCGQLYSNWELCIADDSSTLPHIRNILDEYSARDARIKIVYRRENGHISAASNSALEIARGGFTVLMDHDDLLAPHALALVAEAIECFPEADLIYSDEDQIDEHDRRFAPKFKPDWSPELFYSMNMLTHLSAYRTELLREVGGFRIGYEGSQDYDLSLRVIEKIDTRSIHHIPHILYHWRALAGSAAASLNAKPYAYVNARRSLNEYFERNGINARSVEGYRQTNRTIYSLPEKKPKVSIIIFGSVSDEPDKLLRGTDYESLEILLFGEAGKSFSDERVRYIDDTGSLYASLNSAARAASGEVLCFLSAGSNFEQRDWLTESVSIAIQKDIGAVGSKVLYPDGRIKHAGYILGINEGIGRAYRGAGASDPGRNMRLAVAQNVSAVSVDCMAIRRDVFEGSRGFDEVFGDSHADVDLCLRLLSKGYRNVWTPWSTLKQSSGLELKNNAGLRALVRRWQELFDNDPYYNPNLTRNSEDYALAFPPNFSNADREE
jgi:glycosyltransferase involved in cell wall biosynthesis